MSIKFKKFSFDPKVPVELTIVAGDFKVNQIRPELEALGAKIEKVENTGVEGGVNWKITSNEGTEEALRNLLYTRGIKRISGVAPRDLKDAKVSFSSPNVELTSNFSTKPIITKFMSAVVEDETKMLEVNSCMDKALSDGYFETETEYYSEGDDESVEVEDKETGEITVINKDGGMEVKKFGVNIKQIKGLSSEFEGYAILLWTSSLGVTSKFPKSTKDGQVALKELIKREGIKLPKGYTVENLEFGSIGYDDISIEFPKDKVSFSDVVELAQSLSKFVKNSDLINKEYYFYAEFKDKAPLVDINVLHEGEPLASVCRIYENSEVKSTVKEFSAKKFSSKDGFVNIEDDYSRDVNELVKYISKESKASPVKVALEISNYLKDSASKGKHPYSEHSKFFSENPTRKFSLGEGTK